MATLEEVNQNLREICPILAGKIRQCVSDEEASELLYSSLSEFISSFVINLQALLDTKFPSIEE